MKRLSGLCAAIFACIIPLSKDRQDPACKDRNCVGEAVVKAPELPHSLEGSPQYQETEEWVYAGSPPERMRRDSELYQKLLEINGGNGNR